MSRSLKSSVRNQDTTAALKALAEHIAAAINDLENRLPTQEDLEYFLGKNQNWRQALKSTPDFWINQPEFKRKMKEIQLKSPLNQDDLQAIYDSSREPLIQARKLIQQKQPKWLIGWRDITNTTNERTLISTVFPRYATGHTIRLLFIYGSMENKACFVANLSSIVLDYVSRQFVGGTHLTVETLKQLPVLTPDRYVSWDMEFVVARVLELTYTSYAMRPWAEDLGYSGPPFTWDTERRVQLRAELDGFFARKYGLSRDELRYVLDPTDTHGPDHPSETFRILRDKEIAQHGRFVTRDRVLAAYDQLSGVS